MILGIDCSSLVMSGGVLRAVAFRSRRAVIRGISHFPDVTSISRKAVFSY